MSDIAEYLRQIISAKYGREVRQSIHDAIQACYEDGKSGATDLIAREQILAVIDEQDAMIRTIGGIQSDVDRLKNVETIIFDASSTTTINDVLNAHNRGAVCLMKSGPYLYMLADVTEDRCTFYSVITGFVGTAVTVTAVQTFTRSSDDYFWQFHREEMYKEPSIHPFTVYTTERVTGGSITGQKYGKIVTITGDVNCNLDQGQNIIGELVDNIPVAPLYGFASKGGSGDTGTLMRVYISPSTKKISVYSPQVHNTGALRFTLSYLTNYVD